MKKKVYPCGYS
jgi:hypothetical protein